MAELQSGIATPEDPAPNVAGPVGASGGLAYRGGLRVFKDKRVLLGVSGGISVYKVCTLASRLTQAGALVDVVMTEAATRFVNPLSFQSLTGRAVYTDLWSAPHHGMSTHIAHVGLAHNADYFVVAPATSNTMAKLAHGIADNMLSTLALAARCPFLLAPAMDLGMWANPATKENARILKERGMYFAGPAWGRMASGFEGEGRMVEPEEIFAALRLLAAKGGSLRGRKVVVSAGPTNEYADPVRFLGNPSSGKQGYALAQAALDRGAEVVLVSGPVSIAAPAGAKLVKVTSAEEMRLAVNADSADADVLVMAAAVADYRPLRRAEHKVKKGEAEVSLELERTRDILKELGEARRLSGFPRVLVGFAAETERVEDYARDKLLRKGADMVAANQVGREGSGFGSDTNSISLLFKDGSSKTLPQLGKEEASNLILDEAEKLLG